MQFFSAGAQGYRAPYRWLPVLLLVPFLGLAACSSDEEFSRACPRIVVVKDAQDQVRFVGEGRDLTDVAFEARIDAKGIECDYDDQEIDVSMEVRIEVSRGPASPTEAANLDYFVAVARSDRTILARDQFGISVEMPGNHTRVVALDEVTPTIPLQEGETGKDYFIYVGLSLTPEEMDYNRKNR
ncbi:MAG TPA: hypothetical protein VKN76_15915 [Kiloniellaceae bacterium]|nr:hypothetical protein [Kiloniellaceae bacterium]